ncbi:patatin-domain-containing protein [Wilcoxina mikolae CBS 423.85]|nr:patatin-domain-containing protein [Wilcoxina mikolae CBS 423.85]
MAALPFLSQLYNSSKPPRTSLVADPAERERHYHQLVEENLKNATNYSEWLYSAEKLDELEGNNAWKLDPASEDYNYRILQTRLRQLEDAQNARDIGKMLFLIRTTFSRNVGNVGSIDLYRHSHTGTKRLIEEYISSCLSTIERLLTTPKSLNSPSNRDVLESLEQTRRAYGRTALLLSGGATLGMVHIGVIKALKEADLLPRIISGASAGSIVASVVCTTTDDELPAFIDNFAYGDLAVFDDESNPESVFQRVARFLKIGAWIDIEHLIRVMKSLLGDMTFQEAYYRTRRVLNICVSSASTYNLPRLLNYISSPNVIIWSAVAASCSVPFVFSSASLLAKDPITNQPVPWNPSPQRWIDGSVENDLPMARLGEMFNVNHFIVSQVNPHYRGCVYAAPFLSPDQHPSSPHPAQSWGATIVNVAMAETMHRMTMLAEVGLFRTPLTKIKAVLSQKYSGDITILPEIVVTDLVHLLKNPTPEFMLRASLCGERATWPKLSRVRNHCAIELALDKAVHLLRSRILFSPSQANLRGRRMLRANGSPGNQ